MPHPSTIVLYHCVSARSYLDLNPLGTVPCWKTAPRE